MAPTGWRTRMKSGIFSKSWGEGRSDLLSDPMAVSKTALLPHDIEKIQICFVAVAELHDTRRAEAVTC